MKELYWQTRKGNFQKDYPSNKTSTPSYPSSSKSFNKSKPYTPPFTQTSSQNPDNHQKDYKGKYKGLKAKMVILTKRINDLTKGKNEKGKNKKDKKDEPSLGKANARSGQWVNITMRKVHKLLFMTDNDERKHVLDYTHVDLYYVEDQRKKLETQKDMAKLIVMESPLPGCLCECHRDHLGKFDEKADDRFFLGYSPVAKAFRKLIEALEEEGWIIAMQEDLNHFERSKVWTLVPKPHGKTITGTKWIWKNKMDENGVVIKNKARLVT
nr:uncharacterized mitochondrial protein AtMg00820-like [Tanacetum cinerariifolium]